MEDNRFIKSVEEVEIYFDVVYLIVQDFEEDNLRKVQDFNLDEDPCIIYPYVEQIEVIHHKRKENLNRDHFLQVN